MYGSSRLAPMFAAMLAVLASIFCVAQIADAKLFYATIYQFKDEADGWGPLGLIADKHGNLYGTTYQGGDLACYEGCGTVYELMAPSTPGGSWTKHTLHLFGANGTDGYRATPTLLLDGQDNLIGTTYSGGLGNAGAIYKLTRPGSPNGQWKESILFDFSFVNHSIDGNSPGALLFAPAGGFYGTTFGGGSPDGGLIYQLTPNRQSYSETVLHVFDRHLNGRPPGGSLIQDAPGNLYGIRFGSSDYCNFYNPTACGLVYRLKQPVGPGQQWTYQVLHRFSGQADGWFPNSDLTFDSSGNLYGTTSAGGAYTQGILFELIPNHEGQQWAENILFSFGINNDFVPAAGVTINSKGIFYGTTSGGTGNHGVVYQLVPVQHGVWHESILYAFTGGKDGADPNDHLIFGLGGALYGTAFTGGIGPCNYFGPGCGVVYSITPP